MKKFVESQLNYCPLTSMFSLQIPNNKLNNVHEKALRIVYFDYNSIFQKLLDYDASFSVQHRNIQALATEIYRNIFMGFRQQLWRKFSKSTGLCHITSKLEMSFSVEFLK